jgi:hypothetical protein
MSYDPSGGLTGWDLTGFHEGMTPSAGTAWVPRK